jgi:NTP pyrophosphatase (non-canonical NTP hydrolase)
MSVPDYFDRLLLAVDGYNVKFPSGNTPFQIIARLCEEAGELAAAVNHFEDTGVKRQKHGTPDKAALAKEVQDVMRTALSVARCYGIERELRDSIDETDQRLRDGGYITDALEQRLEQGSE